MERGSGRIAKMLLWGIIALAVVLRAWGLNHQLPYRTYIEEDEFIYTALKYGTGDFNPHWFFHPPLYSYALFSLYGVYYLLGSINGWFACPEEFIFQYLVDPSAFYIIARLLSAALVIPSILIFYGLVKGLYGVRSGLIACGLLAVAPLYLKYSQFGCTEPLLLFFVIASAYFSARSMRDGSLRYSLLAGLLAGLATGTKYVALLITSLLVVAHLGSRGRARWGHLFASLAAAAFGFLVVCPFPLIAAREYFANVALLLSQPVSVGEYSWVKASNLHISFVTHYIPRGLGWAAGWLSVAGIIYLWVRHERRDVFVAIVPTVFVAIVGFSRLFYDRYMLLCYPFLAAAAAVLLEMVTMKLFRSRRSTAMLMCVLVAIPSLTASIERVRLMRLTSTAVVAAKWITDNLPQSSRILVDSAPVPASEESVAAEQRIKMRSERKKFGYRRRTDLFFELQRKAARGRKGFDVTRILHPRGYLMAGGGRGYEEEWMTPEIMRERLRRLDRYDYALVFSQRALRYGDGAALPPRFRFLHDFYSTIDGKGRLIKRFAGEEDVSYGDEFLLYDLRGGGRSD